MKIYRLIALAIAALATVCSCEETDQDQPENDNNVSFSLEETAFTFDHNGGSKTFKLNAPGPWSVKVSEGGEWCTVSPSSGDGSETVTVTVAAIPEELEDRNTRVMVTCNGLTLSATVAQTGDPDYFTISPTQVKLGATACDFSITVTSRTREYDVTIVDEWISEVSRSGEPKTGETIVLHAAANNSADGASRSGVVSVCTKDGSCIPVMVEQAGLFGNANFLAMRFTATWCGWCPYMDEAFHKVADSNERFLFVTFHASSGYPLYFKDCEPLVKAYKISGYPSGVINGWKDVDNYSDTDYTASKIKDAMDSFSEKLPCVAGINATASISGSQINVSAEVTSAVAGNLKVTAMLLESGIVQAQTYYYSSGSGTSSKTINDFVHDNVARKLLTGSALGDEFAATPGEKTSFTWSTELNDGWNPENLSVAVWVLCDYGEDLAQYKAKRSFPDNFITNSVIVPVTR